MDCGELAIIRFEFAVPRNARTLAALLQLFFSALRDCDALPPSSKMTWRALPTLVGIVSVGWLCQRRLNSTKFPLSQFVWSGRKLELAADMASCNPGAKDSCVIGPRLRGARPFFF
jgi:hypothetical protein